MKAVPLLIFANKQDLPSAATADEVSERLKLHTITERSNNILPSNALLGTGIDKGIQWLSEEILKMNK